MIYGRNIEIFRISRVVEKFEKNGVSDHKSYQSRIALFQHKIVLAMLLHVFHCREQSNSLIPANLSSDKRNVFFPHFLPTKSSHHLLFDTPIALFPLTMLIFTPSQCLFISMFFHAYFRLQIHFLSNLAHFFATHFVLFLESIPLSLFYIITSD